MVRPSSTRTIVLAALIVLFQTSAAVENEPNYNAYPDTLMPVAHLDFRQILLTLDTAEFPNPPSFKADWNKFEEYKRNELNEGRLWLRNPFNGQRMTDPMTCLEHVIDLNPGHSFWKQRLDWIQLFQIWRTCDLSCGPVQPCNVTLFLQYHDRRNDESWYDDDLSEAEQRMHSMFRLVDQCITFRTGQRLNSTDLQRKIADVMEPSILVNFVGRRIAEKEPLTNFLHEPFPLPSYVCHHVLDPFVDSGRFGYLDAGWILDRRRDRGMTEESATGACLQEWFCQAILRLDELLVNIAGWFVLVNLVGLAVILLALVPPSFG
jgi:hypothetical protein